MKINILGIGCGVTMVGLGAYMAYKHSCKTAVPPVEALHNWIPVACILAFTVACTLGFLVVPWVMIGELYPQKVTKLAIAS
jgi:facilitated trehalose transporter